MGQAYWVNADVMNVRAADSPEWVVTAAEVSLFVRMGCDHSQLGGYGTCFRGTHDARQTDLAALREERSHRAYREVVDGEDIAVRVAMLGAQLIGVTVNRYTPGPARSPSCPRPRSPPTWRIPRHILLDA